MEEKNILNENRDEVIDLTTLLVKLWKKRKFIITVSLCGAVFGLMVAFSLPKIYEAKVTFAPETEQKLGSGVSSIASMMGVSLDNSIDAISVDMFPDVIASTPFVYELFDLEVETQDGSVKTTLLDYMVNHQKRAWWSHVFGAPGKFVKWLKDLGSKDDGNAEDVEKELVMTNLPDKARRVVRYFDSNLTIKLDKKTGKTELSLRMQDPLVVATVLDEVVENLKIYMSDYRPSKDRQDVENLMKICEERKADYYAAQKAYADFADANKNLVKLNAQAEQLKLQQEMQLAYQVYSQIATQLEGARIKEQQAKPVFVILEPVSIPLYKVAPSKAKLLLLFTFLAGCIAVAWILFGKEYFEKFKSLLK